MYLKVPDASQVDVINDLFMLKSHDGDKNIVRTQPVADTQQSVGTVFAPCAVANPKEIFQSITVMEGYEKNSFEVSNSCLSPKEKVTKFKRSTVYNTIILERSH